MIEAGKKARPEANLARLRHIRDLLTDLGWNAHDAQLAVFSKDGFTNSPEDAHLIDLKTMYGVG